MPPPNKPRPKLARRQFRHPSRRGNQPVRRELSAGGVAVRQQGNKWLVALLKTEHKRGPVWVLPKGHVELHTKERISDAARREVEEEAGLHDLSVKDELGITRFAFQAETALVKKTVHYFLMITNQKQLTPQAEEGMIDAVWFTIDEAISKLAYDTDQDIVAKAREKLIGRPARPVSLKNYSSRRPIRAPRIHK